MGSIYSQRNEPAYGEPEPRQLYADTPGIVAWWLPDYDVTIREAIEDLLWYWTCEITDRLKPHIPEDVLNRWIGADELCKQFAWYNVLARFAESRAMLAGWTVTIPAANRKPCLICSETFLESSLPYPFARRLGVRRLEVCAPCLSESVFAPPDTRTMSDQEIVQYLTELAGLIGRAPRQGFGEGISDLTEYPDELRVAILKLLARRPPVPLVKDRFGTWQGALAAAGLTLPTKARRAGRRSV